MSHYKSHYSKSTKRRRIIQEIECNMSLNFDTDNEERLEIEEETVEVAHEKSDFHEQNEMDGTYLFIYFGTSVLSSVYTSYRTLLYCVFKTHLYKM